MNTIKPESGVVTVNWNCFSPARGGDSPSYYTCGYVPPQRVWCICEDEHHQAWSPPSLTKWGEKPLGRHSWSLCPVFQFWWWELVSWAINQTFAGICPLWAFLLWQKKNYFSGFHCHSSLNEWQHTEAFSGGNIAWCYLATDVALLSLKATLTKQSSLSQSCFAGFARS